VPHACLFNRTYRLLNVKPIAAARIADSSSIRAVSFSSARTTKRFPLCEAICWIRPRNRSEHLRSPPRKDHRGVDLISDALPFGGLWYDNTDDAIGYAKFYSRSQSAVIRVSMMLAT
jgi:hypothetical protein